jgi:hypothetical protein
MRPTLGIASLPKNITSLGIPKILIKNKLKPRD